MDQIEEIKQKLDIVDVIGSYLDLKKAGTNYKAVCPFHKDNDPSFMVNPERQIFKCFGCGQSGDVFTFIEEIEGVEFVDALKMLADRAGVKLKQIDKKHYNEKKDIYELNELAAQLYHHILKEQEVGKKAKKYLKDRCIDKKSIDKFQIGYAPKSWETASKFLEKKGFSKPDIVKGGLALEGKQKGSIYDRFRGRIIFPIFNPADRVVGFSARILPEHDDGKMGKYINSPDTPIYNKSKILYGYNFARNDIREKDRAILVEGQTDVITSHSKGFETTVATSGTALTSDQLKQLSRITDRIIFAYDQDSAGQAATKKGIDLALKEGLEVKIALIPGDFKDVDELLQEKPKAWEKALKESKEIIEYYFDQAIPDSPSNISGNKKKKIAQVLLKQIKKIDDPIVKGDWLQKLSDRLGVKEEYLRQAMEELEEDKGSKEENEEVEKSSSSQLSHQERLLGLLLTFDDIFGKIKEEIDPKLFENNKLRQIYKKFEKDGEAGLNKDDQKIVNDLVLKVEQEYEKEDPEIAKEEIRDVVARIKQDNREELKADFARRIKEAEDADDRKKVKQLIKKFQKLISK